MSFEFDELIKSMFLAKSPAIVKKYYSQLTWDIPNNENKIYLTFDDGPIPEVTEWVLDILKQYQIKATFFCIGDNIKKNPEIFQRILEEGHFVGNHTQNHLKLRNENHHLTFPSHVLQVISDVYVGNLSILVGLVNKCSDN